MYFGQISKKWNSVSIWCWLQKVHSLCSLSIFWHLPASIANLCADNRNRVNCFLSLSFLMFSKYCSMPNSVLYLLKYLSILEFSFSDFHCWMNWPLILCWKSGKKQHLNLVQTINLIDLVHLLFVYHGSSCVFIVYRNSIFTVLIIKLLKLSIWIIFILNL